MCERLDNKQQALEDVLWAIVNTQRVHVQPLRILTTDGTDKTDKKASREKNVLL